jgi:hypothetical protein
MKVTASAITEDKFTMNVPLATAEYIVH